MTPIYDQIRQAIAASEKSRYRIWQETNITQCQLSLFMAGNKGLSVETLEKLATCLDLEIICYPIKRSKSKSKKTKKIRKGI